MSAGYLQKTFWICIGAFFVIPAAIYVISYLPYIPVGGRTGLWRDLWENQKNMLAYHRNVSPKHDYGSNWYQWPAMLRPILYFRYQKGEWTESVFAMGNPIVWWSGAAAFFYCLYQVLDKKDKTAAFLCTIYLAPLLPWILVPRSSFLYHYFPCVLPSILCIGYCCTKAKRGKIWMVSLLFLAAGAFLMFYPVISGKMVPASYIENWLSWLPTWKLVS